MQEKIKEILNTTKKLIGTGNPSQIKKAIDLLQSLEERERLNISNDLLDVEGRLKENERKFYVKAILKKEDYDLELQRIKNAVLTLIDEIPEKIKELDQKKQAIKKKFNTAQTAEKPLVFIMYDNNTADSVFAQELKMHLMPLERLTNEIRVEEVNNAPFGVNITAWREQKIAEASLILCLITPSFFISQDNLFALANTANDSGKVTVPILIKSTPFYERTFFVHLAPLPSNREFIASWPDRDFAYTEIVEVIQQHVQRLVNNPG